MSNFRFIEKTLEMSDELGRDNYEVRARCALLQKQIKEAERIYLENVSLELFSKTCNYLQNAIDKSLDLYKSLHKWSEALELAKAMVKFLKLKNQLSFYVFCFVKFLTLFGLLKLINIHLSYSKIH